MNNLTKIIIVTICCSTALGIAEKISTAIVASK